MPLWIQYFYYCNNEAKSTTLSLKFFDSDKVECHFWGIRWSSNSLKRTQLIHALYTTWKDIKQKGKCDQVRKGTKLSLYENGVCFWHKSLMSFVNFIVSNTQCFRCFNSVCSCHSAPERDLSLEYWQNKPMRCGLSSVSFKLWWYKAFMREKNTQSQWSNCWRELICLKTDKGPFWELIGWRSGQLSAWPTMRPTDLPAFLSGHQWGTDWLGEIIPSLTRPLISFVFELQQANKHREPISHTKGMCVHRHRSTKTLHITLMKPQHLCNETCAGQEKTALLPTQRMEN